MVKKTLSLFFMLFLLLAAHQAVMKAEARVCQSQSHGFKGKCFSDHNCALVCRNERFSGGKCRGFRQRCFCTKGC